MTASVERPDGSSRNSFPSGHTATAFMGAEFLRKEYWDVSPWIGVAGYAVAAGTGFFRMYNNRHWLTDVLTGAGIGILSTQAAYWLYPTITKTFFRKRYKNIFISPYFSKEEKGVVVISLSKGYSLQLIRNKLQHNNFPCLVVYSETIISTFAYQPNDMGSTAKHPLLLFAGKGEFSISKVVTDLFFAQSYQRERMCRLVGSV